MHEIYQKYIDNQLVGIMLYEQLSNCMDFLGFEGYKREFEYYHFEETIERKHFMRYYINHYSKLLKDQQINQIEIIPSQYYNYEREDITKEYKMKYLKESFLTLREYYINTIELLNQLIKDLVNKNVIQDMYIFKDRLECYCQRLKYLDRHLMHLEDIGYNINTIKTFIQPELHEQYRNKMKEKYNVEYC